MEYRNVTASWLTSHRIQGSKSKFSKTKNPKSNTDFSVLGDWTHSNSTSFHCRHHGRPAIPHANEICYSGSFSVSACARATEGRRRLDVILFLCFVRTRATFVHFAFINKMSTSGWVPFRNAAYYPLHTKTCGICGRRCHRRHCHRRLWTKCETIS